MSFKADTAELVVQARTLTAAAFRPFGEVIEHAGTGRRHIIASAFDEDGSAAERSLWVSRFSEPGQLPLRVTAMERHPHSAQFFCPLSCHAYLVAVCPSHGDGSPNLDALVAFVAHGAQGVVYARNVWHHAMVVLKEPALFAVSMAKGCDDDDVWVAIDRHVTITPTAAPLS